ncbi:MAG: carboxypeptidase regulatory-like domain-containing protein [Lishizhenia sp.]
MLKKFNLLITSVLLTVAYSFGQTGLGTIKGSVKDRDTEEMVPFAKVVLIQADQVKGGAETDFDGKFQINSVAPGTYDVEVRSGDGHSPKRLEDVIISSDKITFLDNIEIGKPSDVTMIEEVEVVAYAVPLIDRDGGASGATVTREDIAKLPVRSASGVAGTVGGVNIDEGSGDISVRGARSDGTYFYIDGIKVRGSSSLPKSAIQEVSVITGGLPANYGDATGGIISVTTRGPSARYFGSLEAVTSGFYLNGSDPDGYDGRVFGLDKYGYNLVEGLLSGPLLMRKDENGEKTDPILGFLLSVNYSDVLDNRPLSGGGYRIKKESRDELLANPLRPSGTGAGNFSNANFLRADDFESVPWRMNSRRRDLIAAAKIDVNTGPSVNLTFGGSMNYNSGKRYSYRNSLLNFSNFGNEVDFDWRVYGRFTQRFVNDTEGSSSKVKSAFYSLMVDYSKESRRTFDEDHEFNIFNYGHVGTFETRRNPSYDFSASGDSLIHSGFNDEEVTFTASETNPQLAAITSQYYNLFDDATGRYENLIQLSQGNALRNGDSPQSVYNLWDNIGTPFNSFGKFENDQFRVTGSGSVNIGDHSLSIGFEYEQRWDRGWSSGRLGPIGIWNIARQYANFHIQELDQNQVNYDFFGTFPRATYERLNSGYAYTSGTGEYGGAEFSDEQYFFDYNLRQKLGLPVDGTDFIDIDAYDPNVFQLDMFSPDELLNGGQNYISYYGYDHTGEKVRGATDIGKYFNDFDENGNYERFIGAYQPVYIAGYIMDKFAFDDIVFNVGLRVDVFDANQPVLKDNFLVYNAYDAASTRQRASSLGLDWVDIPDNIGDDFVVYVNDVNNPTQINGFRDGEIWYDAQGVQTEDPSTLRGSAGIAPYLVDPSATTPQADAFEDYRPQISVMPRIAFSFPISDEASFFANYDILTKRPTDGVRFDPIDYQFIQDRNVIINNAGLRPEKTIDYAIGFQQVLTRTSSLKINAFYREQRDNVQLRNVFEAYPNTYRTYGNRDFGTVKGLTIAYDLRRTGNIRMTANYTLQFADGTGSDAGSALNLVNSGQPNLRTIFPYSFDQRHAFAITFDYRYGGGKDYNGPVIKNFNVLENTGLNIVTNINSGTPYNDANQIVDAGSFTPLGQTLQGTLNGSRKPWTYRLDMQLDRNFELEFGKDENKKKQAFLNVYIRATNLFNAQNIINVYRATGNAQDDGYLAAAQFQTAIANQLDEQSFRDYYQLKIQNPFNISAPRTIRLGVKIDF